MKCAANTIAVGGEPLRRDAAGVNNRCVRAPRASGARTSAHANESCRTSDCLTTHTRYSLLLRT